MKHLVPFVSQVCCALLTTCIAGSAMSSTSQAAFKGQPITKEEAVMRGWPDGVLDLLNDPVRTDGWNPWFSEWPNDVNHYGFKPGTSNDVKRIVGKLAGIRAEGVRIELHPGKEPGPLGFTTVLPKGNGTAAVFSVGSQDVIDQWYRGLEKTASGERSFGVHQFTECPRALAPTLKLFAGNEAIDLEELDIPDGIEVSTSMSDAYREEHRDDPVIKTIDDFIAGHR